MQGSVISKISCTGTFWAGIYFYRDILSRDLFLPGPSEQGSVFTGTFWAGICFYRDILSRDLFLPGHSEQGTTGYRIIDVIFSTPLLTGELKEKKIKNMKGKYRVPVPFPFQSLHSFKLIDWLIYWLIYLYLFKPGIHQCASAFVMYPAQMLSRMYSISIFSKKQRIMCFWPMHQVGGSGRKYFPLALSNSASPFPGLRESGLADFFSNCFVHS